MAAKASIISESHGFFDEVVLPLLKQHFPAETAVLAAGFFGYGSEVLGLDDEYSTDHHFGLRVNALLPETRIPSVFRAVNRASACSRDRSGTAPIVPISIQQIRSAPFCCR